MLIMASEDQNARLPNAEIVYRRLREVGLSPRKDSFSSLIDEYIQGGFISKTSPEYRVQGTEYTKKERYSSAREASQGFASPPRCVLEDQKEKRLSEEERETKVDRDSPPPIAQPQPLYRKPELKRLVPTSEIMEILGVVPRAAPATAPNRLTYEEAMARNSGPPVPRFEKIRLREGLG